MYQCSEIVTSLPEKKMVNTKQQIHIHSLELQISQGSLLQSGTEESTFWRNLLPKEAESLS